MILGHILGDFYLQSDKIVQERKRKYFAVIKHSLLYALTILAVLYVGISDGINQRYLIISMSVCHLLIDSVKYIIEQQPQNKFSWLKKNLFTVDQIVHLVFIFAFWYLWGYFTNVRWFVSREISHLPALPIKMVLGMLCAGKPVGIWIGNSNLRNYWPQSSTIELSFDSTKNAGKVIGYLERMIVLVFLMYKQFGAIAFVLTAKSVARFKEIEKNQKVAEYYLIGTLMSVGSAMLIAVLLGLVQ